MNTPPSEASPSEQTVRLLIERDPKDDTVHSCSVQGFTFQDDATITAPGLTWNIRYT